MSSFLPLLNGLVLLCVCAIALLHFGSKVPMLFIRFLRRKFVLKEPDGILEYYIKFSDRVPKDSIVVRVSDSYQPTKVCMGQAWLVFDHIIRARTDF